MRGGHWGESCELRGGAGESPSPGVCVLPGEPEAGVLCERVHLDEVALHGKQCVRVDAGEHRGVFPQVRRGGSG